VKNLDYFLNYLDTAEHDSVKNQSKLAGEAAVMLVGCASADHDFSPVEREELIGMLSARFELPKVQAQLLIEEAREPQKLAKLEQAAEKLREHLSVDDRVELLSLAWKVIAADHVSTGEESAFAVKLRRLLGLSMEQALRARKMAEAIVQDGFKEHVEASPDAAQSAQAFIKDHT